MIKRPLFRQTVGLIHGQRQTQHGAATLVIVMVLFFIMTLMAAYANRNLVFEQRMASNYYRAGVAMDAAEAGTEWALAMLNGNHIDAACLPTGDGNSFRDRYLSIDPASRIISPALMPAPIAVADCVSSAATQTWVCRCPASGAYVQAPVLAGAAQMQPTFRVSLETTLPVIPARAGVTRIASRGCTSMVVAHCDTPGLDSLLGAAVVHMDAALVSALKTPPATPLTVKGKTTALNGLGLHNTDPRGSGLLLVAGDVWSGLLDERMDSSPGSPVQQALINDPGLGMPDKMFAMFFGMSPGKYQAQPAMRSLSCPAASDCGPALLAAYNNGVRLAWIAGPMIISTNIALGTANAPMLIVVDGQMTLIGGMRLSGLIYTRGNADWSNAGVAPALLTGALLVEGDLTVSGTMDLLYDVDVMAQLSNRAGSFVRVPGSWWDSN